MRLAPSFTGSHVAVGVLVSGLDARARGLALWAPGTRVFTIEGDRFFVRFGEPRRLRAVETAGAIVCAVESVVTTSPIDAATLRALDPVPGSLVVAEGGALVTHALRTSIDPAAWLALDGIDVVDAMALGPEPERARAPIVTSDDVRKAIGDAIPERVVGATLASSALPPAAPGWMSALLQRLRSLFTRTPIAPATTSTVLAPSRPSFFDRVRAWFAERLLRSTLSRFLAQRQAEYVARMLELFDRGDLSEALKWAIPLGESGAEPGRPTFALPRPRTSLAIQTTRGPGASMVGAGGLYEFLRRRYLAILAKLQADGKIDEAAFVLAELLRDPAAAVAWLERHGRYLQAARLADASKLEVPVRIRTWMLAGEVERAVQIGRREGAMPVAITMLRRTNPKAADALAVAWASACAEAGNYAEAVEQARSIDEARWLVERWLELAIEAGGVSGARMLALRAARSPSKWDDTRQRALALLGDDTSEHLVARLQFGITLAREKPTAEVRTLARAALRTIVRDGAVPSDPHLIDRLAVVAGDGALRADRPRAAVQAPIPRLEQRESPLTVHIEASDVGSVAVLDAALLPSGRVALALGEAGVRVVTRDGRRVHVIDVPAEQLVISDAGTRALAVTRVGSLHRIGRVDLVDGRGERWWEAPLTSYARRFDGSAWLVSERGTPTLVDALDTSWSAMTRVDLSQCIHVASDGGGSEISLFALEGESFDWLRYDETLGRLKKRSPIVLPPESSLMRLAVSQAVWAIVLHDGAFRLSLVSGSEATLSTTLPGPLAPGNTFVAGYGMLAWAALMEGGVGVDLATPTQTLAHVLLDAAAAVSLRFSDGALVIADDRGRVLVLDTMTGELLRDLRIRA